MSDFTLAVGEQDPHGFSAESEGEAVRYAISYVEAKHGRDLVAAPQQVVTLLGADGLVTRPGERIDAFVRRVPGDHPRVDLGRFEHGEADTPDCNGQ